MPPRADAEGDPGRADSERGLSSLAAAYRRAEPYLAASTTLMASVAGFTALGYGLDRWLGHTVQWMLVAGSVIGITVGFVGFFTKVLRADASAKRQRSSTFPASGPTSFTPPPPAGHVRR
jgi:ATP synthase protein I